MKKILALSLFAMAVLISQAWGECVVGTNGTTACCYWSSTNCWGIGGTYDDQKTPADCEAKSGTVVSSCSEAHSTIFCDYGVCTGGSGFDCADGGCYAKPGATECTGGTKVSQCECSHMSPSAQEAESRCGGSNPNPTPSTGDMCLWNAFGDCYPVPNAAEGKTIADCEADAWHFSGGLQGAGTFCSGGTFIKGKDNSPPTSGSGVTSLGCCKWVNATNPQGKCWDLASATEVADCNLGENQFWSGACPDKQGTCPSGPPSTPIIKFPNSQALLVAPYGRSLHISSAREAMVSLYDMSGARVYSGRVSAGNRVFSLQTVPAGSYYAVVQSGSDAKKVPVILK